MKKSILPIAILSTIIFYSCKKETVEVDKLISVKHSWTLDSSLYGNYKNLLTSVKLNDSVLAVANNTEMIYVYTNNLHYIFIAPTYGKAGLFPPSMTKLISASLGDNNTLYIYPTYLSNEGAAQTLFVNGATGSGPFENKYIPSFSTSTISYFGIPTPYLTTANQGYPIIKSKYVLVPYETDFQESTIKFSIISLDTAGNNLSIAATQNFIAKGASNAAFGNAPYYLASNFYDKFFMTYQNQFFRIDTLGNVKSFGASPDGTVQGGVVSQMFTINNNLFAIAGFSIFTSQDKGETWNVFSNSAGILGYMNFTNVGNEVYSSYRSQLWRITLAGSTLNYQELDNDGLETNLITSINKCGKYAFIATSSGLFYRDTTSFNTPKK